MQLADPKGRGKEKELWLTSHNPKEDSGLQPFPFTQSMRKLTLAASKYCSHFLPGGSLPGCREAVKAVVCLPACLPLLTKRPGK